MDLILKENRITTFAVTEIIWHLQSHSGEATNIGFGEHKKNTEKSLFTSNLKKKKIHPTTVSKI